MLGDKIDAKYMPGECIDYNGERMQIGAVGVTGGERYCWLVDGCGSVLMIPFYMLEDSQDDGSVR